jgi:hypothetical protein
VWHVILCSEEKVSACLEVESFLLSSSCLLTYDSFCNDGRKGEGSWTSSLEGVNGVHGDPGQLRALGACNLPDLLSRFFVCLETSVAQSLTSFGGFLFLGCRAIAKRQVYRQRVGTRRCREDGTVSIREGTKPAVVTAGLVLP